jgi:pyridoxine/pyridoxamine 5'-phosphate oxidase
MPVTDPIAELGSWIEEAREAGAPHPASAAFVTVAADGGPSARTVTLKRLEDEALLFSSALWTARRRSWRRTPGSRCSSTGRRWAARST